VRGLAVDLWDLASVFNHGTTTNNVAGNFLGTDVSGTLAEGNAGRGLLLATDHTTVGGTTPAACNVISGNVQTGIDIPGNINPAANNALVSSDVVEGNFIGLASDGVRPLANGGYGIYTTGPNNVIGGTTTAARNVISSNGFAGVGVSGAAFNTVVQGNFIGTDVTGTLGRGDFYGVLFDQMQPNEGGLVGGTSPGAGNLISGNTQNGVLLAVGAQGVMVQGNYIGTDVTGTRAIPNNIGIEFGGSDSTGNQIGGKLVGAGNLISGNSGDGVFATDAQGPNLVLGNLIGTDHTGLLPLGNGLDGIELANSTTSTTIGGTVAAAGNVIAFNRNNGVSVHDSGTVDNPILENSIHDNKGLGIDDNVHEVFADSEMPNSPQNNVTDGGNNLQNHPVLTNVTWSDDVAGINGTLNSYPNTTFRVEFYANPAVDPSGYGQGQTYLGSTSVTTDANGDASFSILLGDSVAAGQVITATATDPAGNTSEFSADANAAPLLDATTTTISAPTITYGNNGTVQVTVSSPDATPTGEATLSVDGGAAMTAQLSANGLGNAVAVFTLTTPAAGNHSLDVSYAEQSNFAASSASSSLQVNPADLTVTADSQTKTFGTANPDLTFTLSGFVNGDTAAVVTGSPTLSTTATTGSDVGSYPITVVDAGTLSAANYDFPANDFVNGTLTVTQATLTISPTAGQSKVYGVTVPTLTYAASGFVDGDTASVLSGLLGTTAVGISPVGTYPFTLGSLEAANYTLVLDPNAPTFAVTPATPTITWHTLSDIPYGTALGGLELDAQATAIFGGTSSPIGGTFTYTPPAGTVLQVGNGQILSEHFVPSDTRDFTTPPADQTVTINVVPATPTVIWNNPDNITYGTPLGATQLNAHAIGVVNGVAVTLAGTFSYTPAAGTVLVPGNGQVLSEHFVPDDTADYNIPPDQTVNINVLPLGFSDPTQLGPNDQFGYAVAALGNDVVVGAPIGGGNNFNGSAYLYDTKGNLIHPFTDPNPGGGISDEFGASVAVVGSDVLVGVPFGNAVYLYDAAGNRLETFRGTSGSDFGYSVAALGNDVLVGAPGGPNLAGQGGVMGAVYLYDTNGTLLHTFTEPAGSFADGFGTSVAAVGNNLLVGAPGVRSLFVAPSVAGAAYLFNASGGLLHTFSDPGGVVGYYFGTSVAPVGSDVVVGAAPLFLSSGGAAYVYDASGNLMHTLTAPNGASSFGISVAAMGNRILVGASGGASGGQAFLFDTTGNLLHTFADPTSTAADEFGFSTAAVGSAWVVGAPGVNAQRGAIYVYTTEATLATTTMVSASSTTSVYGQAETFTATVTSTNPSPPTGTVDFVDTTTGADLGSVPLTGATATLTTSAVAAGIHTITATYSGDFIFLTSSGSTSVQINPADLTVAADNTTKTYGAANPSLTFTLSGFVNGDTANVVSGSPTLGTAATATSDVGNYPITVVDAGTLSAANYDFPAADFVSGTLAVTAATPTITWANPADITYGTALDATQLNATASAIVNGVSVPVDGTFTYTPPAGTVLPAGDGQVLSEHFVPTDTAHFGIPADQTVSINVLRAPLTISPTAGQSKVYLASVPTLTYNANGFVNGDTASVLTGLLGTTAGALSSVGTYPFTLGTLKASNYTLVLDANAPTFAVTPATVTVTWHTVSSITYGTVLGGLELDAFATEVVGNLTYPVAGTFTYTPPAGTLLPVGNGQVLSEHFTPLDSKDYITPADQTITIDVVRATPTINWPTPAPISYGTALSSKQLNATARAFINGVSVTVAGTFTYTPAAGTVLPAGTQILSEHFVPADSLDFNIPPDRTVTLKVLPTVIYDPKGIAGDLFGQSLAAVGNDLVIGAEWTKTKTGGAAYLYDTKGDLLRTFKDPGDGPFDFFGSSVAAMGSNVLIGADAGATRGDDAGLVYLYDTAGKLLQTFIPPNIPPNPGGFNYVEDSFGCSVAAVGNDILVGTTLVGAVYLYNTAGSLLHTFQDPHPILDNPDTDIDGFGRTVAAVGNDVVVASDSAVYVFDTTGKLLHTFTGDIALAAVGSDVLAGGYVGSNGYAYLYTTTSNVLHKSLLTTFTDPSGASGYAFGFSGAPMGSNLLIGAPEIHNGGVDINFKHGGNTYLYDTAGNLLHTFTDPGNTVGDAFGYSVVAVGNAIAVAAPGVNGGGLTANGSGAVYLFFNNQATSTTTTTVTSSLAAPVYGQALTFTAKVTSSGGTPAGMVQFTIDGLPVGPALPLQNGSASIDGSTFPAGNHTVSAFYTADPYSGFLSSSATANPLKLSIAPKPITVTGITVPDKMYNGATNTTLNFNAAQLQGLLPGAAVTLNTAGFTYKANFASAQIGNGIAVSVTGLGLSGIQSMDYTLSQPSGLTGNIILDATTTTVSVSQGLSFYGATLTFTAKVTSVAGTPTGSVQFMIDGMAFGAPVPLDKGSATASTSTLSAGTHSITAFYTSDPASTFSDSDDSAHPLTSIVLPKAITVTGITVKSKVFDGTTIATLDFTAAKLQGVLPGDVVTLNPAKYAANFNNSVVGNKKPVIVTGLGLSGSQAMDYSLNQPSGLTGDIVA